MPIEKYEALPHFTHHVNYPKNDYQFRMMMNAYDALLRCRKLGIEWLIMLDADEFVCPAHDHVYPDQLNDFFSNIAFKFQEVRFLTREVIQRRPMLPSMREPSRSATTMSSAALQVSVRIRP